GIEQPGAFAGTLPGVLAEVIRHFARIRPDLWAFLVEADAHRRSADEGQERAARLAMQVDGEVVAGTPDLRGEPRVARQRRPGPGRGAGVALEIDDIVEGRVMAQQF